MGDITKLFDERFAGNYAGMSGANFCNIARQQ